MADIVEGWSQFGTDVAGIAGLGETEEVFPRGESVRPGIAGNELYMVGEALGRTDQKAVVVRGARVFVGPDGCEAFIRTIAEEEEPRVGRIRKDCREVRVPLSEFA